MKVSLIKFLEEIPDFRTCEGRRHSLPLVVLLVIMGTMSGSYGYRALGDFVKRHKDAIRELLSVPKKRVPSYSTIRRVMLGINYQDLIDAFNRWAMQYSESEEENEQWFAVDGKSIKGTVTNPSNSLQNFVGTVSVFSVKKGIVVKCQQFESKTSSELKTVQALIEGLDLQGVTLTMDALHCQKKTTEIITKSGNDYVIAVKGNQPELLAQIEQEIQESQPVSKITEEERSHGRKVSRTVKVYKPGAKVDARWKGVKALIKVTRSGISKDQKEPEAFYYISSRLDEAQVLAKGIQGHWKIENQLHWVKDKVLKEDDLPIPQRSAATNFSVIRNILINILRWFGYTSITEAQRLLSNDLLSIWQLLRE